MKVLAIVGARPNFMKVAPILKAIAVHNRSADAESIEAVLVHTGQHYNAIMSDAFFSDLDMPQPDVFLGAGSGTHAAQTAEIMRRFEAVLLQQKPDIVMVVGDVNSTIACALVTSKIGSIDGKPQPRIAHVEAGLRSFDRSMPEEVNRVLTDHLSDFLFVTEESGLRNLKAEGIPKERVFMVGNTMIDSLLAFQHQADHSTVLQRLGLQRGTQEAKSTSPYALLTLHRPANVDVADNFLEILEGLQALAQSHPIIFPAHPRTRKQIEHFGFEKYFQFGDKVQGEARPGTIALTDAQGYLDFLCLMKHAYLVVTDSGGIQEETTCLGVPCVTVRENTERPVTLEQGTNVLAGVAREGIRSAIGQQLRRSAKHVVPPLWDGRASHRIVEVLAAQAKKDEPRAMASVLN
jgi:UDP-N-acetylglucosamine 2-epimerase (non-hydrolysing)